MDRQSVEKQKPVDEVSPAFRGKIPPPIAELIGFTMASPQPGHGVVEFEATERHANPMGTLPSALA